MRDIDELRPLTALRLLTIWRECGQETEDPLERSLLSNARVLAELVGTDFADEARRLGAAVAQVHEDLAAATGVTARDGTDLVASMRARLDAAISEVPDLAPFADAARAVFDEVAGSGPVRVHRIHGDLHLGQTLRAPDRWIVIDFEGEPAAPLAERRVPDRAAKRYGQGPGLRRPRARRWRSWPPRRRRKNQAASAKAIAISRGIGSKPEASRAGPQSAAEAPREANCPRRQGVAGTPAV